MGNDEINEVLYLVAAGKTIGRTCQKRRGAPIPTTMRNRVYSSVMDFWSIEGQSECISAARRAYKPSQAI